MIFKDLTVTVSDIEIYSNEIIQQQIENMFMREVTIEAIQTAKQGLNLNDIVTSHIIRYKIAFVELASDLFTGKDGEILLINHPNEKERLVYNYINDNALPCPCILLNDKPLCVQPKLNNEYFDEATALAFLDTETKCLIESNANSEIITKINEAI